MNLIETSQATNTMTASTQHLNISAAIKMQARSSSPSSSSDSSSSSTSSSSDSQGLSSPIPIQPRLHKTDSEARFHEDCLHADYKDYCMYERLVAGIRKQQAMRQSIYLRHLDDVTISNIVSTRCFSEYDDDENHATLRNLQEYHAQEDYVNDDSDGVFYMDI